MDVQDKLGVPGLLLAALAHGAPTLTVATDAWPPFRLLAQGLPERLASGEIEGKPPLTSGGNSLLSCTFHA